MLAPSETGFVVDVEIEYQRPILPQLLLTSRCSISAPLHVNGKVNILASVVRESTSDNVIYDGLRGDGDANVAKMHTDNYYMVSTIQEQECSDKRPASTTRSRVSHLHKLLRHGEIECME